jgi:hypothetical protein
MRLAPAPLTLALSPLAGRGENGETIGRKQSQNKVAIHMPLTDQPI